MFRALQMKLEQPPVPEVVFEAVDLDAANEEIQIALEELLDVEQEMTALEGINDSIEDLMALQASIEQFGLQPGQVAFADHGKRLSTAISTFPAVEGMVNPYLPDSDEAKAAIEGVVDTIKNTVSAWAEKAWKAALSGLTNVGSLTGGWVKKFKDLLTNSSAKVDVNGKAPEGVPNAAATSKIMEVMKKVPEWLKNLWSKSAPKTEEEYKQLTSQVGNIPMLTDQSGAKEAVGSWESEGYSATFVGGFWNYLKALASGSIATFFKNLGTVIKGAFSKLGSLTGEGATWARKWLSYALSATWKAIRGAWAAGLRKLWDIASKLFKGGTKQLAGPSDAKALPAT